MPQPIRVSAGACMNEVDIFIENLTDLPSYRRAVIHSRDLPARRARYCKLDRKLSEPTAAALASAGITRLYTHQADAIDLLRARNHTAITTASRPENRSATRSPP